MKHTLNFYLGIEVWDDDGWIDLSVWVCHTIQCSQFLKHLLCSVWQEHVKKKNICKREYLQFVSVCQFLCLCIHCFIYTEIKQTHEFVQPLTLFAPANSKKNQVCYFPGIVLQPVKDKWFHAGHVKQVHIPIPVK